jgi:hypothetical protein
MDGSFNRYIQFREQCAPSDKAKYDMIFRPVLPLLGIHSRKIIQKKNSHRNIDSKRKK